MNINKYSFFSYYSTLLSAKTFSNNINRQIRLWLRTQKVFLASKGGVTKKTKNHSLRPMLKHSEREREREIDGGLSPQVAVKEAEIFLADPCVEPLCLGSSLIYELVNPSGCHVFIFPSRCPFINL